MERRIIIPVYFLSRTCICLEFGAQVKSKLTPPGWDGIAHERAESKSRVAAESTVAPNPACYF